ncbi:MAG: hypothetical protein LBD25_03375 [Coriobacteriales bacterium]|jgi:hypothetical protein|nr:hypothetical protein [Coriobacteriales bacterium]
MGHIVQFAGMLRIVVDHIAKESDGALWLSATMQVRMGMAYAITMAMLMRMNMTLMGCGVMSAVIEVIVHNYPAFQGK